MTNPDVSGKDSPDRFTNESSPGEAVGMPASAGERAEPEGVPWAAIRPIYEGDMTITLIGIYERFGISKRALQAKIDEEDWVRRRPRTTVRERIARQPPPTRRSLIRRMMGVLERHVTRLENEDMPPTDKEAVLLGSMSRTLGKLIELDAADAAKLEAGKTKAAPSADLSRLRKMIADRIDQLNQG